MKYSMTKRLYYDNSRLISFEADVLDVRIRDQSTSILLNKTAFYPTSGGQPSDTGTIDESDVVDVWEEDNQIWHKVTKMPESLKVRCAVDWDRRFDHMQQHSGQHILSAIFLELFNANTIGFHLGEEYSTIDLDQNQISRSGIKHVEDSVNKVVWDNLPVKIQYITDGEINQIPLRKPPQVSGRIRVIRIGGLDASACGGTHVSTTGEIGLLKIIGIENYKGGIRIRFLAGYRGLKDYQKIHSNVQQISASLSIHQDELPETINRLQTDSIMNLRSVNRIRKELMHSIGDKLWLETIPINGIKGVVAHWEDLSMENLRDLTNYLRVYSNTVILLAATQGEKLFLISSRSKDLLHIQANSILNGALKIFGGKGGGTDEMAQGGAPKPEDDNIVRVLKNCLIESLTYTSTILK
jgi:alanyl-tRNA synthetase